MRFGKHPNAQRLGSIRHCGAWAAFAMVGAVVCVGCSTAHYVEKADREVYEIIEETGPLVKNMDPNFTIEPVEITLEGLPRLTEDQVDEFLGEAGQEEVGAYILSLERALEIAVQNSRDFQDTKESLYEQVLGFTLVRQDYRPVIDGGQIDGRYSVRNVDINSDSNATAFVNFVDDFETLTGSNAGLLRDYADLVEAAAPLTGASEPVTSLDKDRSVSGSTGINVDVLLRGGARIAAGVTSNFLRFVTGDPRESASSALFAEISQPLLGSNRLAARENILQAERSLLYDLRNFTRARKQFSLGIVSDYYNLLQSKNTVRNQYENYQANLFAFRRAQAELEQGKTTETQVGLSEEAVLSGQNAWINSIQDYNDRRDAFKIQLGLPMDTNIVLDSGELDEIMERGLMEEPAIDTNEAIQVAFANRLDYYTRLDQMDDVARRLQIAGEGLLPDIEVSAGIDVPSASGNRWEEFDFKRYTWDAALQIDPKLNRKGVRNAYRRAVLSYDQSKRDLTEFEDTLSLDLRSSFRALDQLRFQYEIQLNRVDLSERRVLELEIRRRYGDVNARDEIEAQEDLTAARNTLVETIIDHTLANLRLWLDMGILYVKENGQWEALPDDIAERENEEES